jgi:general secretion pathway protein D
LDEGRYAEAQQIARQAADLDPDSEISALLREKANLGISIAEMTRIKDEKERGVYFGLRNAEESAIPFDETMPLQFGDTDEYAKRVNMRAEELSLRQYSSESERQIWNLLKEQRVQGEYRGTLFEAIDQLSTQAGVNIIFDNIALAAEGIETNRQVDVPIREPISLRSALNVILGSAGLVFVVEDEVIKVTSKDAQRRDVKPKTYYVGDLVTPVKNFNSGLDMNFMTPGGSGANGYLTQNGFNGNQTPLAMAQNPASSAVSPIAMAQQANAAQQAAMGQQIPNGPFGGGFGFGNQYGGGPVQTGTPQYNSIGPPTLGGITEADFEPLIDLIKTTIDPESWDDTNGDGTIQSFVPNLSLIVSQTQEVQDEIQDLLQKLRELNDVQIVIEVRFITLRDNFFERIGIDFDFRINDTADIPNPLPDVLEESVVVGREPVPEIFTPTADLDVAFLQNSFASAVPNFGGFDVGTAANFGFAILSDIEVFFLIQASKGDNRSNIMQAPTVTMFNGQSASVTDGALRPFVTSVIPVVGDFAVAQQPVITLLPDGTSMNVQAVVSNDRKSVRMTLVPFFSQVQDVQTFTFDGTKKTRRETDSLLEDLLDGIDDTEDEIDEEDTIVETETSGVTIQLPTVGFTTINTVVSVPDGGTVLMGGIKRMKEGRSERGVPFLSNIPYINRLFKNVGIGRETENLMMMVTPRIIIQSEEENAQVGKLGGN